MFNDEFNNFIKVLSSEPMAIAMVKGSKDYNKIQGEAKFYQTDKGVIVVFFVKGLPIANNQCENIINAFHIHEGGECLGNDKDPFYYSLKHYNPYSCSHPYHSGDLPPLFNSNGYAFLVTLTNRFTVEEIIGRTVVIHSSFDDFTTQPSGNAKEKIACGKIIKYSN